MTLTIWQIDPVQITAYYDRAVCDALAAAGCRVRYITSRFLYDDLPPTSAFETELLYFRGLDHRVLLKLPRLRRALRALSYPLGHWQLAQQIRQAKPDIVHIQWSRLPRLDYALIRRIQSWHVPVVHTVHDVVPLFDVHARTDYLQTIYSTVDRLVVHTEANRAALLERYPSIRPERISIVPLIVSPNTAIPLEADQAAARHALGVPLDVPIVLFFGAIRPYKGLDILVDAFKQAIHSRPELHLLVAGRPDSAQDTATLDTLRGQPNVTIRTEFIPYNQVWHYQLAADLAVFPYRSIYQSAALITSMSFGRAVIVSAVGGLPETIDGNGLIVPPENPDALAQAILEVVSDQQRLQQMGNRSRQLIDERHSGALVAERLIALYESLLSGGS